MQWRLQQENAGVRRDRMKGAYEKNAWEKQRNQFILREKAKSGKHWTKRRESRKRRDKLNEGNKKIKQFH